MRSVPEKTLEHWACIYLSNRFPNGALWWPASGEDVLVELPRLAATGPGKTLALELKTTEASRAGHELWIDTRQLERYLNPPSGPPLPVYYVFPVPRWIGSLTYRSGSAPLPPSPMTPAPPEWWRQRVGPPWFGDWLYVMSAQSLSTALPDSWRTRRQRTAKLFTLSLSRRPAIPSWLDWYTRQPAALPLGWRAFWKVATCCGPSDGVRWRTITRGRNGPDVVLVLSGDEQQLWDLDVLMNQSALLPDLPTLGPVAGTDATRAPITTDDGGNERVVLHIPESGLT